MGDGRLNNASAAPERMKKNKDWMIVERVERKKDCMGNIRWKTPSNAVERVKRKKDCMHNLRWKTPSNVVERVKPKYISWVM